jgi:hypothetical protein
MLHILYFLTTLITTQSSPLCTCIQNSETVETQVKSYDIIFKGRVSKIDTVFYIHEYLINSGLASRDSGGYFTNHLVTLTIKTIWKGNISDSTIKIMTGQGGGDCGYYFTLNKDYIIFAKKEPYIIIDSIDKVKFTFKSHDEHFFQTSDCDRTTDKVKQEEKILTAIFKKNGV